MILAYKKLYFTYIHFFVFLLFFSYSLQICPFRPCCGLPSASLRIIQRIEEQCTPNEWDDYNFNHYKSSFVTAVWLLSSLTNKLVRQMIPPKD